MSERSPTIKMIFSPKRTWQRGEMRSKTFIMLSTNWLRLMAVMLSLSACLFNQVFAAQGITPIADQTYKAGKDLYCVYMRAMGFKIAGGTPLEHFSADQWQQLEDHMNKKLRFGSSSFARETPQCKWAQALLRYEGKKPSRQILKEMVEPRMGEWFNKVRSECQQKSEEQDDTPDPGAITQITIPPPNKYNACNSYQSHPQSHVGGMKFLDEFNFNGNDSPYQKYKSDRMESDPPQEFHSSPPYCGDEIPKGVSPDEMGAVSHDDIRNQMDVSRETVRIPQSPTPTIEASSPTAGGKMDRAHWLIQDSMEIQLYGRLLAPRDWEARRNGSS